MRLKTKPNFNATRVKCKFLLLESWSAVDPGEHYKKHASKSHNPDITVTKTIYNLPHSLGLDKKK